MHAHSPSEYFIGGPGRIFDQGTLAAKFYAIKYIS